MNTLTKLLVAPCVALLLFGCGKDSPLTGTDGTGIEVTGYLTESLIQTTSTQPLSDDTPVELRIVGLPGAATNVAEVKATNMRSGDFQTAAVAADGRFEMALMVLKSDSLSIVPVGVDTEESVSIQVDEISEFPELSEDGEDIVYGMDVWDECDSFAGEDEDEEPEPGPEDEGDWEHDWTEDEMDLDQEEDCEVALVQVLLNQPLLSGQLLLLNSNLNLVEPMESENQEVWYGMIRAFPGHVLWLVHETDDDAWSTVYSITVP